MMKNTTRIAILFFIASLMASGIYLPLASAGDKPLVLKYTTVVKSEGAKGSSAQQVFKKELEKLTNRRVKVEYFYNQALANNTEAIVGGLQMRAFDVADWPLGSLAEYSKAFLPLDVPYLIAGNEVALEILRGEVGQMMADRLKQDTGLRVLMITHLGFRHVTNSKRPITAPADLKGLKIRTQSNPLHLMGFKAFGASPTPMSFAELFTALQQGVVDGQENPIYNIYAIKLYEIQDYLSLTSHLYTGGVMLMNDEYYQSLTGDIREAIDKAAIAGREACIAEITESENVWLKEMEPKIKINKLSQDQILAFQKIAKSQWPKMAKEIGVEYFNAIQKKIEAIQNSVQK